MLSLVDIGQAVLQILSMYFHYIVPLLGQGSRPFILENSVCQVWLKLAHWFCQR